MKYHTPTQARRAPTPKGRLPLPLTLASALAISGCTPEAQTSPQGAAQPSTPAPTSATPTLSSVEQAIQGGVVDSGRKAVVGLVIQMGWAGGSCSGSLIAPNLVLTAQHCVSEISTSQGVACGFSRFSSPFGPNNVFVTTETEFPRWGYYDVEEIIVPVTEGEVCGNDIALMVLSSNVPSSEAAPLVPRLDEPVEAGERFTAAGYGHIGDGSGAGTRRSIEDRQIICSGYLNGCQDGNRSLYENEWVGNDGTCQGDSGGPALDDREQVIGVLSRGAEGCDYPVYTDVIYWRDWIREQARRASTLGGYALPAWVDGVAGVPPPDSDADGVADRYDNCDEVVNPLQQDQDADGVGDLCDPLVSRDRGGLCTVCDACTSDDQCAADGGVCLQLQTGGICSYPCRGDFDCPNSTTCVPTSIDGSERHCLNDDVNLNGPCPTGYVCGGQRPLPPRPADDGACHVCEPCAGPQDCASGLCADLGGGAAVCTRACEQDSDCRAGSVCADVSGARLCVNDSIAEAGVCPSGFVCGAPVIPEPVAGVEATPAGAEVAGAQGDAGGVEGPVAGSQPTGGVGAGSESSAPADDGGCQGTRAPGAPLALTLALLALLAPRRRLS